MAPMDNRDNRMRDKQQPRGEYEYNNNYNSRPHPSSPHSHPSGPHYYPPQSPHQAPPQYPPSAYSDGGHFPPPYAPTHPPYSRSSGPPPDYERNDEMTTSAGRRNGGQFQGHNHPHNNAQSPPPAYGYPPPRNYGGYPPQQYPPPPPPPPTYPGYHHPYPGYPPPPPPPDPYYSGYPGYHNPPPHSPGGWHQGPPPPPPEHHGGQAYHYGGRNGPRRPVGNNGYTFHGRHSLTWKPGKSNQPDHSPTGPRSSQHPQRQSSRRQSTDLQTNGYEISPSSAFEMHPSELGHGNGSPHGRIESDYPEHVIREISNSSWDTPLRTPQQDSGSQYQPSESGNPSDRYEITAESARRNTVSSDHSNHTADRSNPNLEEGEIHSGEDENAKDDHVEDEEDDDDDEEEEEYSPPEPIEQFRKVEAIQETTRFSQENSSVMAEPAAQIRYKDEPTEVTVVAAAIAPSIMEEPSVVREHKTEEKNTVNEREHALSAAEEKSAVDLEHDVEESTTAEQDLDTYSPQIDKSPVTQQNGGEMTRTTAIHLSKDGRNGSTPMGKVLTPGGSVSTVASGRPPPPPPPPPEEELGNIFDQEYYKTRRNSQSSQVTQAGSDFGAILNESPEIHHVKTQEIALENNPTETEITTTSKAKAMEVEEEGTRTRTPTPPNIGKGSLRSSRGKRRNPPEATRVTPKRRKD